MTTLLLSLLACFQEAARLEDPDLVAGTWVASRTRLELEPSGHGRITFAPDCVPWCSHGVIERPFSVADYEVWHTSRMLWLGVHEKKAAWPASLEDQAALEQRLAELRAAQDQARQPMIAWLAWLRGDLEAARAAAAKADERGLAEAKALGVDLTAIEGRPPPAKGVLGEAQQSRAPGATVFEAPGRRLVLVPGGAGFWIVAASSPWPAAPELAPGSGERGALPPIRYPSWRRDGDLVQLEGGPTVDLSTLSQVAEPDADTVRDAWTARWLDAVGPPA